MPDKWHTPTFASVAVFLAAAFWGLYWIPLRYVEDLGITGTWPVIFLNLPAALALGGYILTKWEGHRRHMPRAILIGIFTGAGYGLFSVGLLYSSVVRVTLLFYLTPIWGTLIGIVWLGDRAGWSRWLAIGGGLAGMALLLSGGGSVPLNIGDLMGFVSGVAWAIGGALVMRYGEVPIAASTFSQMLMTSLIALIAGLLVGGMMPPTLPQIASALPVSLVMALFMIIPTLLVIFWAQKILFPGRLGLLMMAEVMLTVLSASILLPEEAMSLVEWGGAILIVGACLIEVLATPSDAKSPHA